MPSHRESSARFSRRLFQPAVVSGCVRVLIGLLLALGLASTGRVSEAAEAAAPTEDQVKAAFLLNFPKYVEWPAGAFADGAPSIVLTVIGDKKLEEELRRMTVDKIFNGRPIEVRSASGADDVGLCCHILFVGGSERRQTSELLAKIGNGSVLTVGESDDFLGDGGIINLARRDRKIRLEINLGQADVAGLKISSKLLSVAEVVKRARGAKP